MSVLTRYPCQYLGNNAVQVLLLLDADFLVSKGVHEALTASDKASALNDDLTANKRVIVLPAFETPRSLSEETGRTYALEAQACESSSCWCSGMLGSSSGQFQPRFVSRTLLSCSHGCSRLGGVSSVSSMGSPGGRFGFKDCLCHAGTKSELKSMFDEGKIIQFADFYNVGHGSTNYKKWFTASEPYPITYKTGYEPYVLVDRRTVPWYDERFRGYGWDKARPTSILLCPSALCHQSTKDAAKCTRPAGVSVPVSSWSIQLIRSLMILDGKSPWFGCRHTV